MFLSIYATIISIQQVPVGSIIRPAKSGNCMSNSFNVETDRILRIADLSIGVTIDGENVFAEIKRDFLYLSNTSGTSILSVKDYIPNSEEIDIDPYFVVYLGVPFLYWKESFLHKPYRQGLFSIKIDSLEFHCEGVAGIQSVM